MTSRVHSPTTAALAGLLALFVVSCGSAAAQPASAPARTAAPVAATTSQPEAPVTASSPVATVAPLATAPASVAPSEAPATAQTPAPSVAVATTAPTEAPASTPAPTPAPTAAPKTGPVAVSLTDIAIKLDQGWTSAGPVTFSIKNVGTVAHQLVVLKTDIAQNQIPVSTTSPGTVTQPGFLGTTALINPGGSATLTLSLTSGNYVLLCNQPAHYLIGMHTAFKVN